MAAAKIPGWGLGRPQHILETRLGPQGQRQALICPEQHEAPFWIDLQQVGQFQGRFIYDEIDNNSAIL